MNIKKIIIYILPVILIACTNKEKVYQKSFFKLDTVITITVVNDKINQKEFNRILNNIKAIVDKYDRIFNIHRKDSDVYKISLFQPNREYQIHHELFKILNYCKKFYNLSNGYFDPTIGNVTLLYNFHNNSTPPQKRKILQALNNTGMSNVSLIPPAFIKLTHTPVVLDLGGAAKGYIIDRISEFLKTQNIKNFMVNIGGDIYAAGKNPQRRKWIIGLQHPRKYNEIITKFELTDKAVVTSGDYERFFFYKGKRYHHIINPQTGLPVWNGIISVTIIADNALLADVLSTTLFLLGKEKGLKLLNKYFKTIKYLIITEDSQKNLKSYSNFI